MRIAITTAGWLSFSVAVLLGQTVSAGAGGSGPYAIPAVAAYAILENAAHKIVADNRLANTPVILYDAQTFALLPAYKVAVEDLRRTMTRVCGPAAEGGAFAGHALGPVDVGTAASGLGALVAAFTPAYAVQGQALPFDNSALVAAFAEEAGSQVVFPGYLLPATQEQTLSCGQQDKSISLADLWFGAAAQATRLRAQLGLTAGNTDADKAKRTALQAELDAYSKATDPYLAADKGPASLGKLLVAESLLKVGNGVPVIDLKLDAVGMESIARTWVGTKKTNFACSVMAHYTLLKFTADASLRMELKLVKADMVSILIKIPDEDKYGSSVAAVGQINGVNSQK